MEEKDIIEYPMPQYIVIKPNTAEVLTRRLFPIYEDALKACSEVGGVVSCCTYIEKKFGKDWFAELGLLPDKQVTLLNGQYYSNGFPLTDHQAEILLEEGECSWAINAFNKISLK